MKTYEEDTLWFFTISSPLPCSCNLSWLKQQAQEGRKERKAGNIVAWQMTLVFSTSLCKRQVIHKWFSKCWLCRNQIKGSSKHHKEAHEARAGAGFTGALGRCTLLSVPLFPPQSCSPSVHLQQLDFALPASEGFSSGKERVLIPALPHLLPAIHQGWPCKVLKAHHAQRHQETQEETQVLHVWVCQSPFTHHLPLLGKCFGSGWAGCSLLQNWKHQICSVFGVIGRTTHRVRKPPD